MRCDPRGHHLAPVSVAAVAEQDVKFSIREALLVENELVKGEWTDELVYAVLDREWHGGQA